MKTLGYLFLFLCNVSGSFAYPQMKQMRFDHLDVNSGLSENFVNCVLQDSRGFMWFGTASGLNKYDGYKFTIYKNDPGDNTSISNNYITGITEDSRGTIWLATSDGLCRYNSKKDDFTTLRNDPNNRPGNSANEMTSVLEDSQGNIWASTATSLNLFDPKKNQFVHYLYNIKGKNTPGNFFIKKIFEDSQHNLWVCTYGGGLNLFDRKTRTFNCFLHDANNNNTISNNNVITILEDRKHRLWIGTAGGGLDLYDPNTGKFQSFKHEVLDPNSLPNNVILALGEDNDGNLWIGSENGGLSVYNSTTEKFQNYQHDDLDDQSISTNSIYCIYKDFNGNMWLTPFGSGVNIYNINANRFTCYKHIADNNSLNNNNVLCMLESKNGKIWIGTDGGGLNLFDPVTKNFTHYLHSETNKKSICGNNVLSVLEDSKGNLWVGTWGCGITIFNPQMNTFIHLWSNPADSLSLSSNNAWVIFEDRDKNIWVGTNDAGLNLYNPVNNTFTRFYNPEMACINSITEDRNGKLWLGTYPGAIQVFDKKTKTFTCYKHDKSRNSLSSNHVGYIYETRDGNFWINTANGLNYYDSKSRLFTIYTTADGLPDNRIFGLLEDAKGNLWLSTKRGLSCFDPKTKKFKNFGIEDGLQSSEFKMRAFCKTRSGAMYFGGIHGFNEFFPEEIKEDTFEAPLVLTDFEVFNKKVTIAKDDNDPSPLKNNISETKEIIMPSSNTVFSFEFASLNFNAHKKNQYAYMLAGFDKTWNEASTNRTATYTNLAPGDYIFKVRGLNEDGDPSSKTTELKLTITPPYWFTWWFKMLEIIIIAGGAIGFYRYRVSAISKQKIKLQRLVNAQTLQLVKSAEEEYKARREAELANNGLIAKNKELEEFAYVASHDLQEPLRMVTSFLTQLEKKYVDIIDDKGKKYIHFAVDGAKRMRQIILDLLEYSRVGHTESNREDVDLNEMVNDIQILFGQQVEEKKAVIYADRLPVIKGYKVPVRQVFQNLVGNALKYSRNGSTRIRITAEELKTHWEFAVIDNGIGIDKQYFDKIFKIFQRLHNKDEFSGTGIGLAVTKKIIENLGGKIWVESEEGKGSTFYFTILKI